MRKPTLLYVSPFPPEESGISEYSVELIKYLGEYFELTLGMNRESYCENGYLGYNTVCISSEECHPEAFAYRIYNIGNNPFFHSDIYRICLEYPGLVILHDWSIYYLFVGYHQGKNDLYSKLYQLEEGKYFFDVKYTLKNGVKELLYRKELSSTICLNEELFCSNNYYMVHSEYARKKTIDTGLVDASSIRMIPMVSQVGETNFVPKSDLYAKYNIPEEAFVIASLGRIDEPKRNREITRAVKRIQQRNNDFQLCYVMVGEGYYVNEELEEDKVIKTGFTSIEELNSFALYADIITNLRFPTGGETSATLVRALELGKCILANKGGWFSEIPNHVSYIIESENPTEDEIVDALEMLINSETTRKQFEKNAKQYAEEQYDGRNVAKKIYHYMIETEGIKEMEEFDKIVDEIRKERKKLDKIKRICPEKKEVKEDKPTIAERVVVSLQPILEKNDSREVIVYGGGKVGKRLLEIINNTKKCEVVAICDNHSKEKEYDGIPIMNEVACVEKYPNALYIISVQARFIEIIESLLNDGVKRSQIAFFDNVRNTFIYNE